MADYIPCCRKDKVPRMTFDEIEACLRADGWPVETLRDHSLRTGFQGISKAFPVFVYTEGSYVVFAIVPYRKLPGDEALARTLMDTLLRLNDQMVFAKFSVDEDGDAILSVEYPMSYLNESSLRDALDVLAYYANQHWEPLSAMGAVPALR